MGKGLRTDYPDILEVHLNRADKGDNIHGARHRGKNRPLPSISIKKMGTSPAGSPEQGAEVAAVLNDAPQGLRINPVKRICFPLKRVIRRGPRSTMSPGLMMVISLAVPSDLHGSAPWGCYFADTRLDNESTMAMQGNR